jgi:hypothetical protein
MNIVIEKRKKSKYTPNRHALAKDVVDILAICAKDVCKVSTYMRDVKIAGII